MSALENLIDLADTKQCTASCLLATEEGDTCACRCQGRHHGAIRNTIQDSNTGLVGLYWSKWEPDFEFTDLVRPVTGGIVKAKLTETDYLLSVFGPGAFRFADHSLQEAYAQIVSLEDMKDFMFDLDRAGFRRTQDEGEYISDRVHYRLQNKARREAAQNPPESSWEPVNLTEILEQSPDTKE